MRQGIGTAGGFYCQVCRFVILLGGCLGEIAVESGGEFMVLGGLVVKLVHRGIHLLEAEPSRARIGPMHLRAAIGPESDRTGAIWSIDVIWSVLNEAACGRVGVADELQGVSRVDP